MLVCNAFIGIAMYEDKEVGPLRCESNRKIAVTQGCSNIVASPVSWLKEKGQEESKQPVEEHVTRRYDPTYLFRNSTSL